MALVMAKVCSFASKVETIELLHKKNGSVSAKDSKRDRKDGMEGRKKRRKEGRKEKKKEGRKDGGIIVAKAFGSQRYPCPA